MSVRRVRRDAAESHDGPPPWRLRRFERSCIALAGADIRERLVSRCESTGGDRCKSESGKPSEDEGFVCSIRWTRASFQIANTDMGSNDDSSSSAQSKRERSMVEQLELSSVKGMLFRVGDSDALRFRSLSDGQSCFSLAWRGGGTLKEWW